MTFTRFAAIAAIFAFMLTAAVCCRADELSPLNLRVIGQDSLLWRGPAAVRVIVTNEITGLPEPANVTISVADSYGFAAKKLFSGRTNADGTIDAAFRVHTFSPGSHTLLVNVVSPIGSDSFSQPVNLASPAQLLLTCDKPVYQPGQVIHLRALARDIATGAALADQPITFEVEDGRGNKVYKSHEILSSFGIASDDFQLADEVNMGAFTLRAITSEDTAEKTVTVSQYVLPKFKVSVSTDRTYYLPGETLTGTLNANYFFGKPLDDATVHLSLNTADIGVTQLASLDGRTDATGVYHFSFKLPSSFIGQPIDQGKARAEVDATVTDTASQVQQGNTSVPVVESPVVIALVPESRQLVPGVANHVYIAVATPDGAPLAARTVTASIDGGAQPVKLMTDSLGIAVYSFKVPGGGGSVTVHTSAIDAHGRSGTADLDLSSQPDHEGLILRTDKTLATVGDVLHLDAVSSSKNGTLYIDVIRDGQTILTQSAPMVDGNAGLPLRITPDMTGTIELHAYKILANEDIIRDTRLVVVSPADSLTVTMSANKQTFRPGEDAVVDFNVRDKSGSGVVAALGVAIVDESVFALSELQPGLEKIYFTLEKELMEPKYEIHGLTPEGLILNPGPTEPGLQAARQAGAAMLLADAPAGSDSGYDTSTFDARYTSFIEKTVSVEMSTSYGEICDAIDKYAKEQGKQLTVQDSLFTLVKDGYLPDAALKDHWGRYYHVDTYGQSIYENSGFAMSSSGIDGVWGTADDIIGFRAYMATESDGTIKAVPYSGNIVTKTGQGYDFQPRFIRLGAFGGMGHAFAIQKGELNADVEDEVAMAAPELPQNMLRDKAATYSASPISDVSGAAQAAPRLRQYFPETMYWNPSIITDGAGHAQVTVPLADSITTWRASIMANTESGLLGSADAPIKVFQDFFVDMDLPLTMTQHDHVDLPVVVYNYLPKAQNVAVTLNAESWFALSGPATRTIHVGAGDVESVSFPLSIIGIGKHELTVTARGEAMSDAMRKPIEVVPDGKEVDTVVNDQIEGTDDKTISLPDNAIAGASSIWVKVYPGAFSQVVDGLDGLLRMPSGCFEQTSSSTYPDVLVLDYLKQTRKINPEMQMAAEQYINIGYQRLVTFECHDGGFSWFGDEPANQILTAYGLLEFTDMSRVHDVDPALISRTSDWLARQQHADGSWLETNQGIAEGIINRQTGALRTTAYVAWALSEAGYKGAQIDRALDYVKIHASESKDPYTEAVILNFLDSAAPNSAAAEAAAETLAATAKDDGKTAYWTSDTQTFTGAVDDGADLETTGLAAYGLARYGRLGAFTGRVLTHLVQAKNSFGCWGTTQGTVWSLKALLYAGEHSVGGNGGRLSITANGKQLAAFTITSDNSDVMRQVSVGDLIQPGANDIRLTYVGDGSPLYQIVGRSFVPWSTVVLTPVLVAPLTISVDYDKTQLLTTDTANVTVTIHNQTDDRAEMPLIDVGVPPGFTVDSSQLEAKEADGTISKYTVAERQIIIYLLKLDGNATVTLHYALHAKYPIKAKTPLSKVYPYYNPEKESISPPQDISVN